MRKTLVLAAALITVVTVAVAATAAIPDANGVIHGCRNTKTGVLRVIHTDKGQTCTKDETALTWNQTGPAGPAGPAGRDGVSGYEVVTDTQALDVGSSTRPLSFAVTCPDSKKPISAGFKVRAHRPLPDGFTEPVMEWGVVDLHSNSFYPDGSTWHAEMTLADYARALSPQNQLAYVPTDVTLLVTCITAS